MRGSTRLLEFALIITFLVIVTAVLVAIIGPQVVATLGSFLGVRLGARLALRPATVLLRRLPVARIRTGLKVAAR